MKSYFDKVSKAELESIYDRGVFEKGQLTYSVKEKIKVIKAKFIIDHDNKKAGRIYIFPLEMCEIKDQICAFSFKLGTRLFFFKNKVGLSQKGFYVDAGYEVLEIKRRKHTRLEVPNQFVYECQLMVGKYRNLKIPARMINFSESGAKFVVNETLSDLDKDTTLIMSLKATRRSSFLVVCLIRFVNKKKYMNYEIGVEFIQPDPMTRNKIVNICDDIMRLQMSQQKKK